MKHSAFICVGLTAGTALCGLSGLRAEQANTVDVSGYPAEAQQQYKVFSQKCSRCHDLSRPLTAKYTTATQWRDLVDRMARKPGAGISRRDQAAITGFLVYHQQVQAGGAVSRAGASGSGSAKGSGDAGNLPPAVQKQQKLFSEKCSRCHDLARPLTAKYKGESQWRELVLRMARKPGAGVSRRDAQEITAFLVYREKAGGTAPAAAGDGLPSGGTPSGAPAAGSATSTATASEGGLRVEVELSPAQSITVPADGQWVTETPAEGETVFLAARLFDQATGEKVPYVTIHARVGGDTGPAAKTLRPLFGSKGFYYGGNFPAPAGGEVPVSLEVELPSLGRVYDEGARWTGPISFKLTVRGS